MLTLKPVAKYLPLIGPSQVTLRCALSVLSLKPRLPSALPSLGNNSRQLIPTRSIDFRLASISILGCTCHVLTCTYTQMYVYTHANTYIHIHMCIYIYIQANCYYVFHCICLPTYGHFSLMVHVHGFWGNVCTGLATCLRDK